ncbi:NAD-dependent epimerase/dehydratase family protein [Baekduia sp. Peel2402]|uniref:NAD-dependent epimerase/dehydratase family protein n=1 Tax=Baekduia sp. Peel2402 TaxID=3458296 RepID=UPI00403E5E4C
MSGSGAGPATALVTGGTGVIGRALVAALRARGDRVIVLARGPEADVRGDVADAGLVARALEGVDVVFHLAGDALGGGAVNVDGTRAVVSAAAASGSGGARVVVGGTLAVYGPADGALSEDTPFAPVSPYAITNARADELAREHGAIVARLTNVYGPGDRHATRLIPELVAAAREQRAPRLRSDGTPRRDFLHADDAARALIALALADTSAATPGEAYNIGSGVPVSVREVVETLEAITARPLHAVYESGPEDGTTRVADITKVTAATGWRAMIPLANGLRALL